MPAVIPTDIEDALRTWARSESHITAAVSDRVFFGTPQAYEKSKPNAWINLFLVAENQTSDDVGLSEAIVQWDCWGKTKALAAQAAIAVQTATRQLCDGPTVKVGQTVFAFGNWSQRRWLPDPTTNTPRYVVDVLLDSYGVTT